MSAQQRMKVANEKASKNITSRGNIVKPVRLNLPLSKAKTSTFFTTFVRQSARIFVHWLLFQPITESQNSRSSENDVLRWVEIVAGNSLARVQPAAILMLTIT